MDKILTYPVKIPPLIEVDAGSNADIAKKLIGGIHADLMLGTILLTLPLRWLENRGIGGLDPIVEGSTISQKNFLIPLFCPYGFFSFKRLQGPHSEVKGRKGQTHRTVVGVLGM